MIIVGARTKREFEGYFRWPCRACTTETVFGLVKESKRFSTWRWAEFSAGANRASRVDRFGAQADRSAMVDECPMTEDCPGYDRFRRTCLLRPGDCEFSPADGEAALMIETPEALKREGSAETASA